MLEWAKTIWGCQGAALEMIKVDNGGDVPLLKRDSWNDLEGWSDDRNHLNLQFRIWSDEYGWTSTSGIQITNCNTEPEVYQIGTSRFFYAPPRYGSGAIGVALFGMPTILCYSLWYSFVGLFTKDQPAEEQEMSARSQLVLERIGDQVDDDEYDVVKRALIKQHGDQIKAMAKTSKQHGLLR